MVGSTLVTQALRGHAPIDNCEHGTDRGDDRGECRLHIAGLLGLHRLRNPRRSGAIPATPGYSGVQGSNGELLIGSGLPATTTSLTLDQAGAVTTDLRSFEDIAFDHYGYFSQDIPLTTTTTTSTTPTVASTTAYTVTLPPVSAGNLFVSDLSSGLSETVTLTSIAEGTIPAGVSVTATVPVHGPTIVGLQLQNPSLPYNATTNPLVVFYQLQSVSPLLGGRIIQITPQGVVSDFAQGFDVYTPIGVTSRPGHPIRRASSIRSYPSRSRRMAQPCGPRTIKASGSSRPRQAWPTRQPEP